MKQLLILSGKGGTGKTTLASAFIKLSCAKACADCDVDAPNLHLILTQNVPAQDTDYYGMPKAYIDADLCVSCGRCRENCRFDAISAGERYRVDPFACEGCGVCEALCPAAAISLKPAAAGSLTLYADDAHVFSTAQLKMGNGTSGMLVTEVKKQMAAALPPDTGLAIIDGSPGIGCPVISSLSGVDMAMLVTEPSVSGISDLKRIMKTAGFFHTPVAVCINKYDTNPANTRTIEDFCREEKIPVVGKVPFDPQAVQAINSGKTIVEVSCPAADAAREVFASTMELLRGTYGEEDA